jgi:hypothetical protein
MGILNNTLQLNPENAIRKFVQPVLQHLFTKAYLEIKKISVIFLVYDALPK